MATDVGRKFLFTRVLELVVELDEYDVEHADADDTALEVATAIAGGVSMSDWSLVAGEEEELK